MKICTARALATPLQQLQGALESYHLQAELQRLKQVHGKSLSLSRGKGSEAPFPIAATLDVAAPSDAYAYDVSGFQVS